jgi:hypothetical protein
LFIGWRYVKAGILALDRNSFAYPSTLSEIFSGTAIMEG